MKDAQAPIAARSRRRLRAALVAFACSLCVALVAAELGLRYVLFEEGALTRDYGYLVRVARIYADGQSEDDFWKLQQHFTGTRPRAQFAVRDEQLGWLSNLVEPATYRHKAERWLGGRRPVLMYGDSFTACLTPRDECWEGLMKRDAELGASHCLVNYGVCAYGLDQTYLLLRDSLPRWADRDPIVVVGVLVDDDIDRVVLGFRGCPKPRTRLVAGELEFEPPGAPDIDAWLAEHPLERRSYLWRFVTHRAHWLPDFLEPERGDRPELVARKSELGRALIEAIRSEVDAHGFELVVVLFHEPASAAKVGPAGWRERLLVDSLEQLGVPYVSSKRALHEDARRSGRALLDYYMTEGPSAGHFDAEGNQVVFGAIARALRGEFDGPVAAESGVESSAGAGAR